MNRVKKILSLILALSLMINITSLSMNEVCAATSLPSEIYLKQDQRGTCTLSSAAMMLRSKMYLSGNSNWSSVTESSIRSSAWAAGGGLLWDWSYSLDDCSFEVSRAQLSGISVSGLKAILDTYPEGVVLHCRSVPHAVFLTDYEGDQFYCADPASSYYSGKRILLEDSYLGRKLGSQSNILSNASAYWYISASDVPADTEIPGTEIPFADVLDSNWYIDSVKYVYRNGIMNGLKEDTFGPLEKLTRAEFAVMLYRLEDEPEVDYTEKFADVEDGMWYTDAILWANQNGIIKGYDETHFGPADNITREQTAVMLYRYAKYKEYDVSEVISLDAFEDKNTVNAFAKDAMGWTVGTGIINGKDAGVILAPGENTLRAECAAVLMRFMEKYELS